MTPAAELAVVPHAGTTTPAQPQALRHPLQFSGSGGEYFRIWIVNLLLTLLTFGIYSAWAKVRKLQYFYRNTRLDGNVFDYHGKPGAILKGRLIALGLIAFYNFAFGVSALLGLAAAAVMVAVLPWLLVQSLRFKAHNTSYRGLRFRFSGSVHEGYFVFGLPLLVIMGASVLFAWSVAEDELRRPVLAITAAAAYLVLALCFPWVHFRVKRYQHGNSHFGQARGRFRASLRRFYAVYGMALALLLVPLALLVASIWWGGPGAGRTEAVRIGIVAVVAIVAFYLGALCVTPFVQARLQNHVWNHTLLGLVGFDSSLKARRLIWVAVSNLVLIVVTLGLFTPFAAVRTYRVRLEAVAVLSVGPLGEYVARESREVGATGEGAADLLELDFAL